MNGTESLIKAIGIIERHINNQLKREFIDFGNRAPVNTDNISGWRIEKVEWDELKLRFTFLVHFDCDGLIYYCHKKYYFVNSEEEMVWEM